MCSTSSNSEINSFEDDPLKFLTDGSIRTEDGGIFHIHKIWLAQNCKFFYEKFCGTKDNQNDILVTGIKAEVMGKILLYLYNGEIEITNENVIELMIAVNNFSIYDLFSRIKMHIKQNLSINNCLDIFLAAMKINKDDILQECYRFLLINFERLVYTEDIAFGVLPLENFQQLLRDKNLCVKNEKTVYSAIVMWIDADVSKRLHLMPDLLTNLYVSDMDENLATEILNRNLVASNPFCQHIFNIKLSLHNYSNLEIIQHYIENNSIPPIRGHRLPTKLNLIAQYCVIKGVDSIQLYLTYDGNIDWWRKITWRKITESDLNSRFLFALDENIYCFEPKENRNFRYDIFNKEWNELNGFLIDRHSYEIVESGGKIYVLGGVSTITEEELYDVEIYDVNFDEWYLTSPMIPISCFASVALDEDIYVVGYKMKDTGCEMIAQVNHTPSASWKLLPAPFTERSHFALTAYYGKIYAIGGFHGKKIIKNVEIFDPSKQEWRLECDLPYAYCYPRAAIIRDLLIVYEDHMVDREYMKSNPAVFWDIHKRCWERIDESSPLNNLHLFEFLTLENRRVINELSRKNKDLDTKFERSPFS